MSKSIEILARGVCVRSGKLLLCRSRKRKLWYLPGGHVDFGEAADAALEREIREELGLKSTAGRFLGAVEHAFRQSGKAKSEISLLFQLSIPGIHTDRPVLPAEPKLAFRWMPLSELARIRMEPSPLGQQLPAWLRRSGAGWASTIRRARRLA
jgi:ADP-ribose pyrophosphatase YjhB (NUDIX family)